MYRIIFPHQHSALVASCRMGGTTRQRVTDLNTYPLVIFTHRISSIYLAIQSLHYPRLTLLCTTDVRTNFPSVFACDKNDVDLLSRLLATTSSVLQPTCYRI